MGLSEVSGGKTMSRTVLENEDLSVRADHEIEASRPCLLIIDKSGKNCQIIDVATLEDRRMRAKEDDKVEK